MVSNRTLGLLVIASEVYRILVVIAMHFLQPEVSPLRVPISAYVFGAYGTLMTISYFVSCAAWLGLTYGLVSTLPLTRLTRIASVVALFAVAGSLIAGIFPMDFPPPPRTTAGRLHLMGGILTFPASALAAILFSRSMRRDGDWKRVSVVASAFSAGIVAAYILMVCSIFVLGFGGYAQRLLLAMLSGWKLVVGLHLTRIHRVSETSHL
jgi:hypothetical protein